MGPSRSAPAATILLRFAVGFVFVTEGIQKFVYPDALGAGRFARIGLPWPEILAPFVGLTEVAAGLCVFAGLFTRVAAAPLLVVMGVALATTKIPIAVQKGFFAAAHEARTDLAMTAMALFLVLVGPGPLSVDALRPLDSLRRRGRGGPGDASPPT